MRRALITGVLAGAVAVGCGPEPRTFVVDPFEQEVSYACNPACRVENECTGRDLLECVPACYEEIEHRNPPRPPCDTARLELAECQGMLDCDELEDLQNDEPNPCSSEADEVAVLCE